MVETDKSFKMVVMLGTQLVMVAMLEPNLVWLQCWNPTETFTS